MTDEPITTEAPKKKAMGGVLPWIVIGGLMMAEGAGVYLLTKFLTPAPESARADQGTEGDSVTPEQSTLEIDVGSSRITNRQGARTQSVTIDVALLVSETDFDALAKRVDESRGRLHERINVVLRRAETDHLHEPGFETIKRQLKSEFANVLAAHDEIRDVIVTQLIVTTQ